MSIERALAIELEEAAVEPAVHPDERQPRGGDAGGDRLRIAQREQDQRLAPLPQRLDGYQRVLAAADRHACPPRQVQLYCRIGCGRKGLKPEMATERDAIAKGKFGEAHLIKFMQEPDGNL